MKFIHFLSGLLLLVIILLLAGGSAYIAYFQPDVWVSTLDMLKGAGWRMTIAIEGVGIVLILLFYLISFIRPRKKIEYLSFKNDGGVVNISMVAARDFIQKSGDAFSDILGMKCDIGMKGGHPVLAAYIKVRAGAMIPELTQLLQSRIRQTVMNQLGLTEISDVKIIIDQIVGEIPKEVAPAPSAVKSVPTATSEPAYQDSGNDDEEVKQDQEERAT